MTDPINTARQEGIALGLAMALDHMQGSAKMLRQVGMEDFADAIGSAAADAADIAPIPPHVAAARVLLDMPPNRDGLHVLPDHMRAALEQIAGGENG